MTPETIETTQPPVVKDAAWEAWLEKGRRNDRATARRFKLTAAVALSLVILVWLYLYWL